MAVTERRNKLGETSFVTKVR